MGRNVPHGATAAAKCAFSFDKRRTLFESFVFQLPLFRKLITIVAPRFGKSLAIWEDKRLYIQLHNTKTGKNREYSN